MHPVLFEIGSLKIHTYGFMMAVGFLAALTWIRFQSRRMGLSPHKMTDLAFYVVVVALVGSRIAFIVENWRHYSIHPLDMFKVWQGGLVFQGGVIAALIVAPFLVKKLQLPFWKAADAFAPGLALGHALGRVGCFFAGCCHGKQCDPQAWYGVTFPEGVGSLAPTGVALYPTQLIESVAEIIVFLFLAYKSQKKGFDGQILLLYLIIYSLIRIGIEFLRGDLARGFLIDDVLSKAQMWGVVLAVFGIVMLFVKKKGRS